MSIFVIALGATVINKDGDCSAPIKIFLEGLFGIYVGGLFINLCIGFSRCCSHYILTDTYKKKGDSIRQSMDNCYIPL